MWVESDILALVSFLKSGWQTKKERKKEKKNWGWGGRKK
jgi:hypothetical protein